MENFFRRLAHGTARTMGSSKAFFFAIVVVVVWAVTGPMFRYSDTWQLLINTATTIVTFLMVILIQHTQNHDSRASHLKLDELLRAVRAARTSLVSLEEMSDEELTRLEDEFERIRASAMEKDKRV